MKKSIPLVLYTALCLALCAAFFVGFWFAPAKAGANERLAPAPALRGADGKLNTDLAGDAADFFSGRFWLRQELISVYDRAVAGIFRTSPVGDVLLGTDGWLYYANSLDDYTGLRPMTERELFCCAENLRLMREWCEGQGARFLFTAAPNKNTLYDDHMPNLGAAAAVHDTDRLYALLAAQGTPYLDLAAQFRPQGETLYFAHDSHWNARGAALAADAINAALGRASRYFDDPFDAAVRHDGDLYEMLYPAFEDPETDPVYGGALRCDYGGGQSKPDSITLNTTGGGRGSLLCFRDSFGNNLHPYLADSFAAARFSRATAYDLREAADYDAVLIELVERNLDYLLSNVPAMPAPARPAPTDAAAGGELVLRAKSGGNAPAGCRLLRGTLPVAPDTDSPVLLICGGTAYEAFLLGDGAFAAWLPEGETPEAAACAAAENGPGMTLFEITEIQDGTT